jgi:hypothetical protein
MTTVKNHKAATALVAISAIAAVLIGSGHFVLAASDNTIVSHVNNTGVNVQTSTNQEQKCDTAGGSSGISGSCTASSTDNVMQSGGIYHK